MDANIKTNGQNFTDIDNKIKISQKVLGVYSFDSCTVHMQTLLFRLHDTFAKGKYLGPGL